MPRFKGGASGLSPLAIQLSPSATGTVEVVGWYAGVEADPAVATVVSRPVITRPSVLGTPAGPSPSPANIVGVTNPAAVSSSELLTAYGTPPSFPSVAVYATLGPWDVQWAAAPGSGLLVLPGAGLLLYGVGGAWNGLIEWNEP